MSTTSDRLSSSHVPTIAPQSASNSTSPLTHASFGNSTHKSADLATNLFPPHLISPTVSSALPEGYSIRPLQRTDYEAGMLDVLRVLTTVGDINKERWEERFDWMKVREGEYFILVVTDESGKVVGTGAVVVERKFIHNLGLVAHIEDIAVAKDQQGKKLGLRIIQALNYVAEKVGCYKSILDCSEANEGFYVKCGYKRAGLEMSHYFESGPKSSTS